MYYMYFTDRMYTNSTRYDWFSSADGVSPDRVHVENAGPALAQWWAPLGQSRASVFNEWWAAEQPRGDQRGGLCVWKAVQVDKLYRRGGLQAAEFGECLRGEATAAPQVGRGDR